MESEIIEYGIILSDKYKAKQTEVIPRLLFNFLLTNYKNIWLELLHSSNTFSYLFHSHDITSLEKIHPITFWRSSLIYKISGRHEWHKCDTSTTQIKTYFHSPAFTIWQVKDYKERNNFILKTTFWKCLMSMPKDTTKTELFNGKRYIRKLFTRFQLHVDALAQSNIVGHSNAASFRIKTILCENINVLFSKNDWKLGKMNAIFSWKRDFLISSKLQMSQISPRSFLISYIQIENTKTTRPLFKYSWILLYFWHSKWQLWLYFGKSCKTTRFRKPTDVSQNTLTFISIGPLITK